MEYIRNGNPRSRGLFYEWDEKAGIAALTLLAFRLINMYPFRYPR